MVKIGMMMGDRYEILEKIGTGGMSDVYKAKCHKLNRYVAVKVLKQEFSENANFVSKFHVEAQAAAGLMHPNIVNVYDVGEENGIHYIVMELVEGITLKKYIEKKARLSYKEAVSIAIQVSMGIEAAHNNHIIHRDIKPQNIIISKDGKVKVTDFGIAKAATSNTITSNVMGSVHYTSPEQARGGYSDEKSDIYSLGITLFEMLTGRVPFNGETTVAIAIKHIQEEIPSPKEFVPEIPSAVEGIVFKCCQKSPDRRYQSIQSLIGDLKQSLMNPDENFVVQDNEDIEGNTRMITESDMAQIKRSSAYQNTGEFPERDGLRLRTDTESMYQDEEEEDYSGNYRYNRGMEKITTILAIVAGIVVCVVIFVLVWKIFSGLESSDDRESPITITDDTQEDVEYVDMPDIVGVNVEDARNALQSLGLIPAISYEESDTIDENVVIRANAKDGTPLKAGTKVTVIVSAGVKSVEVPPVEGMTYDEAKRALEDLGLVVNRTDSYSDSVAEGLVASQMPAARTQVPKGNVVTVNVSLGKEEVKVRVPYLIGRTEEDGTFEAIEAGLKIRSVTREYNAEIAEGLICYQSHSQGSYVELGTELDIKISLGAEKSYYKCNTSIEAPTVAEAPDYVSGTEVKLFLVTDDGRVLLDTVTSTFPQAANYYGLTAPGGTLTMTYTVTTGGGTTTDPVTGEVINTQGSTQEKSFTRRIEFVEE